MSEAAFVRAKRVDSSQKTFPRNRRTKLVLAPSSRRCEADLAAFLSTQQPPGAHISSRSHVVSYSLFGQTSEAFERRGREGGRRAGVYRSTRENRRGSSPTENRTLKSSSRTYGTVNIYSRRKNYKLVAEVNDYPLRVIVAERRFLWAELYLSLSKWHYLFSIFME